jgi:hypothetical protein
MKGDHSTMGQPLAMRVEVSLYGDLDAERVALAIGLQSGRRPTGER